MGMSAPSLHRVYQLSDFTALKCRSPHPATKCGGSGAAYTQPSVYALSYGYSRWSPVTHAKRWDADSANTLAICVVLTTTCYLLPMHSHTHAMAHTPLHAHTYISRTYRCWSPPELGCLLPVLQCISSSLFEWLPNWRQTLATLIRPSHGMCIEHGFCMSSAPDGCLVLAFHNM